MTGDGEAARDRGCGGPLPPLSVNVGSRRRPRVLQLPLVLWLAVVWMLLWGTASWANAITGVLLGAALCLLFPLPPLDIGLRLRPVGLARLLLRFSVDMARSGQRVTRQILTPGTLPSAVVAVPLRCRGDLLLAAMAVVVSAVPGSTVVELRRATATLFIHVLGASDQPAMDRARREVWRLEERVVRAFGTRDEIGRLTGDGPRPDADDPADRSADADTGRSEHGDQGGQEDQWT